ncbi:hypothetical protein OGAPHI_005254 [Ogataea philodendri]|uniref:Uncharacterized protein n=1 Tax=Ogataea philodendri TaxID=1378263 RepID=A0A9P8P2K9_9ASCO|nr:uncharacterized protein OGAPHI_005254 [Ogataea philodendri]KAH3663851.1 hypothetical protein OGAPHI_005254 [Ogataea philodendri]
MMRDGVADLDEEALKLETKLVMLPNIFLDLILLFLVSEEGVVATETGLRADEIDDDADLLDGGPSLSGRRSDPFMRLAEPFDVRPPSARFDPFEDLGMCSGSDLVFLDGESGPSCDTVVLDRFEVDGDAEWGSQFVVSGVSLTNRSRRVVHLERNLLRLELVLNNLQHRLQSLVVGQWHQQHLGWSHQWWQRKNASGRVLWSRPERVLKYRVENTANTERWLNHRRNVLSDVLCLGDLFDLEQLGWDLNFWNSGLWDLDGDLELLVKLLGQVLELALGSGEKPLLHLWSVFSELWTKPFLVDLALESLNHLWLGQSLSDTQLLLGSSRVHSQVVGRSVGTTNTLDPSIRGLQLCVPTVLGIMGHLVRHVLSESESVRVDTDLDQEQVDSGQKVSQGLVVHHSGTHSLANGDFGGLCRTLLLDLFWPESELDVLDGLEPGVALVERIHKVLDLGHQELSHTQKSRSWRNLVSERLSNGGRSKRHLLVVGVQQLGKVQKLALGGLWTQVTLQLARWTDGGLKHQVERHWLLQWLAGSRVANVVLDHDVTEFRARITIDLGQNRLVLLHNRVLELDRLDLLDLLLSLLFLVVLLNFLDLLTTGLLISLESGLQHLLDQMVRSEDLACFQVSAHPVSKLVHMTRGLEHLVRRQHRAVHLQHVLLQNEVLSPNINNVGLQCTSRWTIVVKSRNTSVNLKSRGVEKSALQNRFQLLSIKLAAHFQNLQSFAWSYYFFRIVSSVLGARNSAKYEFSTSKMLRSRRTEFLIRGVSITPLVCSRILLVSIFVDIASKSSVNKRSLDPWVNDSREVDLVRLARIDIDRLFQIDQGLHSRRVHRRHLREIEVEQLQKRSGLWNVFFGGLSHLVEPIDLQWSWVVERLFCLDESRSRHTLHLVQHQVDLSRRVRVHKRLSRTENNHSWWRRSNIHLFIDKLGVHTRAAVWVVVLQWNPSVVCSVNGSGDNSLGSLLVGNVVGAVFRVGEHRVHHLDNTHSSQERSVWLTQLPQQGSGRGTGNKVDSVLDRRKHSDDDTDDEDGKVQRLHFPQVPGDLVRGKQVANSVHNNGRQSGFRNVVESIGETVNGEQHTSSGENTSKRSLDTTLGLQSSSTERSGGWVGVEERSNKVGDTNGNQLLVRVNLVVVDSSKRLGDRDVFQHQNDGCSRKVGSDVAGQTGWSAHDTNVFQSRRNISVDTEGVLGLVVSNDEVTDQGTEDDDDGGSQLFQVEEDLLSWITSVQTRSGELPGLIVTHQGWDLSNKDVESGTGHEGKHGRQGKKLDDESESQKTDTEGNRTTQQCHHGGDLWGRVLISVLVLHTSNKSSDFQTHNSNRSDRNVLGRGKEGVE